MKKSKEVLSLTIDNVVAKGSTFNELRKNANKRIQEKAGHISKLYKNEEFLIGKGEILKYLGEGVIETH